MGANVCCCKLPAAEAVALSTDARLLACARGGGVDVYLLHTLVDGRSAQPLATWQLPDGAALKQARANALFWLPRFNGPAGISVWPGREEPQSVAVTTNIMLHAACVLTRRWPWTKPRRGNHKRCAVLQFAWRPVEGQDPPQCAAVTADGALLTGGLGARLEAAAEGVGTAAWSDDGALLAFARQECVTVRDVASGRSFTTRIMSGVRP